MMLSEEIDFNAPSQCHVSNGSTRQIIDKQFVHKSFERNVLVSSIVRAGELMNSNGSDYFSGTFQVACDHDFFFEHPRTHVPGLYIIEAGRQFIIAITHMYYDVPFGVEFVMNQLRARPENRERHSMLCSLRGQTPR